MTGTAPSSAGYGKAVIGFEDMDGRTNSPGEQYNTYWDSASVNLGAGGAVESSGGFPVNYPNTWLRLKRAGNIFVGFASRDGVRWTALGTVSNPLPSTLYLGMAVTSTDTGRTTTAEFRDWGTVSGGTTGSLAAADVETLGPSSRRSGLVVSEIMYHAPSRPDGKNLEYVEVFNSEPIPADLTGFRISGDADYEFPDGTVLPAGGFLVVAKIPGDVAGAYGITGVLGGYSGNLPDGSGTVRLRNARDAVLFEVEYEDSDPWPVAADGAGHSLVLARPSWGEADPRAWAASAVYGGSPGVMESVWSNALKSVVINEFLAHTDPPFGDFVELYNHGTQSVDISGCFLSDSADTNKYQVPASTTLPARGFRAFTTNELGFNLSSSGEVIFVRGPDGSVLDAVRFGATHNAVSSGRYPDGAPGFHMLASVTQGTNNTALRLPDIVINEIMYHPISESDADEYVELYKGASAIH